MRYIDLKVYLVSISILFIFLLPINSYPKETKNVSPLPKESIQKKNLIKKAIFRKDKKNLYIEIIAEDGIKAYKSYVLRSPTRLVIDFPNSHPSVPIQSIPIYNRIVKRIRIAKRPNNVTRCVIDFTTKVSPLYGIEKKEKVLIVKIPIDQPKEIIEDISFDKRTKKTSELKKQKISLDFKDADLKNVFRLLSEVSGFNIIVGENVKGKITLKIDDIPWDEALDLILDMHGLGKIITHNIIRIETRETIKKINEEKLAAKESIEKLEPLVTETIEVNYAKAADLVAFIKGLKLLSERGSIQAFDLTNKITVQDIKSNVEIIKQRIKEQDIPTRQVLIEARIVQANPSFTREIGIRWGGTYQTTRHGGAAAGGADINVSGTTGDNMVVNLPAPVGPGSGGGIAFGYLTRHINLDVELSALEREEKVKIISSPKILALDNQEARIKQGVALPYLKLSEEGVTSTEFKDAVLELKVTPKITPNNTIRLHLFVTKNQKSAQTGAGGEPGIDVREAETDLLVGNGKTVVIGGIYETTQRRTVNKVPFFAEIPWIGRFFKNVRIENVKTELLIFLTTTIVEPPESLT